LCLQVKHNTASFFISLLKLANRNPNDTANLLTFIQLLRKSLDAKYPKVHKVITVAASVSPFLDSTGHAVRHFESSWVSDVDYFYLMV
jgi:chitinase